MLICKSCIVLYISVVFSQLYPCISQRSLVCRFNCLAHLDFRFISEIRINCQNCITQFFPNSTLPLLYDMIIPLIFNLDLRIFIQILFLILVHCPQSSIHFSNFYDAQIAPSSDQTVPILRLVDTCLPVFRSVL